MRCFKHLSNASNDALISKIEARFGIAGYARFFKLIEAIAASMKPGAKPILALPWAKWERILAGQRKKLFSFLAYLQAEKRVSLSRVDLELGSIPIQVELELNSSLFQSETVLEINFPNIKECRDE